MCEEVHLNLAYRWFCRLGLNGEVPDQSAGIGMSLAVRASGSLTEMVVLEELDMKAVLAAAKKAAGAYKPAG